MTYLIDKSALVAELKKKIRTEQGYSSGDAECGYRDCTREILSFLNTLEVKEIQEEPTSTAYVVTRCEEHSDYVEEVFFDENKAQEYCDQFKRNENEYARHITKVKVTL